NTYSFSPASASPSKGLSTQTESSSILRLQRVGPEMPFGQISDNQTLNSISAIGQRGEGKQSSGTLPIMGPPKLQSSFSTSDLPTVRANNFLHVSRGPPEQRRDGSSEFHQVG